ncbi:hypothetical protein M0813_04330 [Anaeramoeba flamelloides]|uniref:Uncharacterized protein n=1 Tax=Anaeramoeba flamelloides TaxID=1746091 RepID=A0ABQ8XKA5_9EUKA|nr:hypothetical protein M0813_04330 [Anaeramoeba flamelloides]
MNNKQKAKANSNSEFKQCSRSNTKARCIIVPRIPKPSRTKSRARKGFLQMSEMTNLQLESWGSMTQREQGILKECRSLRNDLRIETFQKHFPKDFVSSVNKKGELETVKMSSRLLLALSVATQTGSSNLRSTFSSYFNRKGLIRNPNNPKFRKGACLDFVHKDLFVNENCANENGGIFLSQLTKIQKIKSKKNRFNSKKYKILFPTKSKFSRSNMQQIDQSEKIQHMPRNENKENNNLKESHACLVPNKKTLYRNSSRAPKGSFIPKGKHTKAWNSFSPKEQKILLKGKDLKRLNQRFKMFEKNFEKPHLEIIRDKNLNLIKVSFSSTFIFAQQCALKQGSSGVRNAWRLFFNRKGLKISNLYFNGSLTFIKVTRTEPITNPKPNSIPQIKVYKSIQWWLNDDKHSSKNCLYQKKRVLLGKENLNFEKIHEKDLHLNLNRKRSFAEIEKQTRDQKIINHLRFQKKFTTLKRNSKKNILQRGKAYDLTKMNNLADHASKLLENIKNVHQHNVFF